MISSTMQGREYQVRKLVWYPSSVTIIVLYFDLRPEQNAIQGDSPEGGGTFRWPRGRIKADSVGQGEGPTVPLQGDASGESDLWASWQLFRLDGSSAFGFKDRVGVERLYNSVEFDEPVAVELESEGDEMW